MTTPELTIRGRLSVAYYRLRRLFVAPAPDGHRCFMGEPVAPEVHCPRRVGTGGLWCAWHERARR